MSWYGTVGYIPFNIIYIMRTNMESGGIQSLSDLITSTSHHHLP